MFFGPLLDLTGPNFDQLDGDFGDDIGVNFHFPISENWNFQADLGSDISSSEGFHNFFRRDQSKLPILILCASLYLADFIFFTGKPSNEFAFTSVIESKAIGESILSQANPFQRIANDG